MLRSELSFDRASVTKPAVVVAQFVCNLLRACFFLLWSDRRAGVVRAVRDPVLEFVSLQPFRHEHFCERERVLRMLDFARRKLLGAGTPRELRNRFGRLVLLVYLLFTRRINQKRFCRSRSSASVAKCCVRSRTRLRRPLCRQSATCTTDC